MSLSLKVTFNNEFDLTERELDEIFIKETCDHEKCIIWDARISSKAYCSFLLSKNNRSKIICELSFYKSSITHRFLPRPVFKRLLLDSNEQFTKSEKIVSISFQDSSSSIQFWKLIGFLNSYKSIVDLGEFERSFKVYKEDYFIEFKSKSDKEKVEDLIDFIKISDLTSVDIKSITFESRKKNIKAFYYLLKNIKGCHSDYRNKYTLSNGEEYIWHHFLKQHDWILGLNADIKFIRDFYSEQKIGMEDSSGSKSPKTDFLGISEYTVLIELKHSNTDIFKKQKSKGRANTWDFTFDFIESLSQALGQKFDLEKYFKQKDFISDGKRMDTTRIESIDPKTIVLIGNKKREFPLENLNEENLIKNKTLERFRRNCRNIDILSFDELFERAYHIVYSQKLNTNWYNLDENEIFEE